MVVVVVEDFGLPEKSSNPTPPPPPANGAQDLAEFDRLIARVGRIREPSRSRCRRAYMENPEGFAYIVSEALAGDKPAGLLVWMVKRGEHRHGRPFTDADIKNVAAQIEAHRHVQYVRVVTECAHGCGETVCIDDGEAPILCLRCRQEAGYPA